MIINKSEDVGFVLFFFIFLLHKILKTFATYNSYGYLHLSMLNPRWGGQANHRNLIVRSVSRVRTLIVRDPHCREIELSAILANTQKAFGGASHVRVEAMAEPNLLLFNNY